MLENVIGCVSTGKATVLGSIIGTININNSMTSNREENEENVFACIQKST
jgi:hypothetical protein